MDVNRALLWVLLPLALLGSIVLVWQGVPLNLRPYVEARTPRRCYSPLATADRSPACGVGGLQDVGLLAEPGEASGRQPQTTVAARHRALAFGSAAAIRAARDPLVAVAVLHVEPRRTMRSE